MREVSPASNAARPPGLVVEGLLRHFGGVRALDGVSFQVAPGECLALIGPNGAGKSTCFACLAGQLDPGAGAVSWRGQNLLGLSPAQRLALGVARTFQVAQVFGALSVLENVQLALAAAPPRRGGAGGAGGVGGAEGAEAAAGKGAHLSAWRALGSQHQSAALEGLAAVGLADDAGRAAKDLPYGARKRLELAIALAPGPGLLLLDEPAAGLSGAERHDLMARVRCLASAGMAVLYTEHNMDAVFGVADRVLVLVEGRLLAQGTAAEVAADEQVRLRYLGRSFVLPGAQRSVSEGREATA